MLPYSLARLYRVNNVTSAGSLLTFSGINTTLDYLGKTHESSLVTQKSMEQLANNRVAIKPMNESHDRLARQATRQARNPLGLNISHPLEPSFLLPHASQSPPKHQRQNLTSRFSRKALVRILLLSSSRNSFLELEEKIVLEGFRSSHMQRACAASF